MGRRMILLGIVGVLTAFGWAWGQVAGPGGAGGPGAPVAGRVGRGIDPAQFKQQMLESVQDQMEVTEDEWKAISPKIEKVMEAQRNARTGAGLSITRSTGAGTSVRTMGSPDAKTETGKAMGAVKAALADKDVSAEELGKRIAAFREARDKAKVDLAAAQKELAEAVTPRQEAVLITLGLLD